MLKRIVLSEGSIVVQSSTILSSNIDNEALLLSIENSKYYGMDSIGSYIWSIIEKPTTIRSIIEQLVKIYDVNANQCKKDVTEYLDNLLKQNLITVE